MKHYTRWMLVALAAGGAMLLALTTLSGCKSGKGSSMEALAPYVRGFSSGHVSTRKPILVEFTREMNTALSPEQWSFSPSIKGQASWLNGHTLAFTPSEPLEPNKRYSVSVNLKALIDTIPSEAKKLEFEIMTLWTRADLFNTYFYSRATGEGTNTHEIRGTLALSEPVSQELLNSALYAVDANGTSCSVTVEPLAGTPDYTISIQPTAKTPSIEVSLDHQKLGMEKSRAWSLRMPPDTNELSYIDYVQQEQGDQSVRLIFSQPLDNTQDIQGLLLCDFEFTATRDANTIVVRPLSRIKGSSSIYIQRGVRSTLGHSFAKQERISITWKSQGPELSFLNEGTILPLTENLLIPVRAKNLRGIDVSVYQVFESNELFYHQLMSGYAWDALSKVGRLIYRGTLPIDSARRIGTSDVYALDLTGLFATNPGANYSVGISMRKELRANAPEPFASIKLNDLNAPEYGYTGEFDHTDYYEEYDWQERDNPEHATYYATRGMEWRNLQVTNLGITAKVGMDSLVHCFVTGLADAEPIKGVELELYSYQLQGLSKAKTDGDGYARLSIPNRAQPFLVMARNGDDRSALAVSHSKDELSFSSFDVSGVAYPGGRRVFIYGERGVWRPGDTMHLHAIAQPPLPEGHPAIYRLRNGRNQTVENGTAKSIGHGIYSLRCKTPPDAETGRYTIEMMLGGERYTQSLRVERIEPNRLATSLRWDDTLLFAGSSASLRISSKWLHGATARGLPVTVEGTLSPVWAPFKGYESYSFSAGGAPRGEIYRLVSSNLSADGTLATRIDLPSLRGDVGPLRMQLSTRTTEPSGAQSINSSSIAFHPYRRYVGIKNPESQRYYLETGKDQNFEIVLLSALGTPVPNTRVEVMLYKMSWGWWWEHSNESFASYQASSSLEQVGRTLSVITDGKGRATVPLRIEYPSWGRYLVRAVDREGDGGHQATCIAYWDWPDSYSRDAQRGGADAKVLMVSSDKAAYTPGEKMKLTVPTPEGGRLLLTLENAIGVQSHRWIPTEKGRTEITIEATPEMAPNVYANVILLQPHGQTENDLPLRMYGALPLMVNYAGSKIEPELKVPSEIKPSQSFSIEVAEKEGRPMTVTLAIVDEGLLGLTAFQTPDPWRFFNQRTALGVRTYDYFDRIIGAYAGRLAGVLRVGGGEAEQGKGQMDENRFLPVVRLIGPIQLKAKERKALEVTLPQYIGQVRVMAVAQGEGVSCGSTQAQVLVRQQLMVQVVPPRAVAPGERVDLPITVFNLSQKGGTVNVKLKIEGEANAEGASSRSLTFSGADEQTVTFPISITGEGPLAFTVEAQGMGETSTSRIVITSANPNPEVTQIRQALVDAGKDQTLQLPAVGKASTASWQISSQPIFGFYGPYRLIGQGSSNYLIDHLSRAVALAAAPAMGVPEGVLPERRDSIVNAILASLSRFQVQGGGFALWTRFSHANSWASCYVAEAIAFCQRQGYDTPAAVTKALQGYLTQEARAWQPEKYDNPEALQAYRLLVLAKLGKPALPQMNSLREGGATDLLTRYRLAAAYAIQGTPNPARELLQGNTDTVQYYHNATSTAQLAAIIDAHAALNTTAQGYEAMTQISTSMGDARWLSCYEIGQAMMAAATFLSKAPMDENLTGASLTLNDEKLSFDEARRAQEGTKLLPDNTGAKLAIKNSGKGKLWVSLAVTGKPTQPSSERVQRHIAMDSLFTDLQGRRLNVSRLKQGQEFFMEITVRSLGTTTSLGQLALEMRIPSGCELLQQEEVAPGCDYQDWQDNGVYSYFEMPYSGALRIRFRLRATYKGRYQWPSAVCRSLTAPGVVASIPGQWITIE